MNINHKDHGHDISGPEGKKARAECRARYIRLRELAHLMSGMGDMMNALGEEVDAKLLWAMAGRYKRMARDLRGDMPVTERLLKDQLAESLPDATPEDIDDLYEVGVKAGQRIQEELDAT